MFRIKTLLYFLLLLFSFKDTISGEPLIEVKSVNSGIVGLYEKYEIILNIEDVQFSNPFNPEEMDLRAVFISPSGSRWEIFGFYDNYQGRNEWKVRFSPNETGQWTYSITLNYSIGSIKSPEYTFEAVESGYKGWIRVSNGNPHYFEHDNGESFYAVGAYYPWGVRNNSTGLGLMESSGANFFGYWNIMYGGESGIIESLDSGLGSYDQDKCGRIDQLIEWAEERNMKMMLAIWPHDLLCRTLDGWAKQWDNNPYKEITTVVDFYESEEAWYYQERQYRYLIARWGYSRGLGVWEIVNEITGTDGWAMGKEAEATLWVKKVSDFLKANDPFGRPTTASQHGGHYWPDGYSQVDISNVHVYETGWNMEYPGNPLRSSQYIYHSLANQFWNDFDQPGIFGEAGASNTYGNFATPSTEYTAHYHNALWASWSGGLAATPVWWSMGSRDIMTADVMARMHSFSKVVNKINYNRYRFNTYQSTMNGSDIYGMVGDSLTFGWVRESLGNALGQKQFDIHGLPDTSYAIRWFDTWTGSELETTIGLSINDTLTITTLPDLPNPDYAFIINPLIGGGEPAELALISDNYTLLSNGISKATITCLVKDNEGLISTMSSPVIDFKLIGPGSLANTSLIAENGYVRVEYSSEREMGEVNIVAESSGLRADTISITLSDQVMIDNFDKYPGNSILENVWRAQAGTNARVSLVSSIDKLLRVQYSIGDGDPPYAGIQRELSEDYSSTNALRFSIIPDNSGRNLVVILRSSTNYWRYDYILSGSGETKIEIPINDFVPQNNNVPPDLSDLTQISFSILPGDGGPGTGEIYLDDLAFAIQGITGLGDSRGIEVAGDFALFENYPNPFNPVTHIEYNVPFESQVELSVFNILGEKIITLVNCRHSQGTYRLIFNSSSINRQLSSGTYLIYMKSGAFVKVNKMMLLK